MLQSRSSCLALSLGAGLNLFIQVRPTARHFSSLSLLFASPFYSFKTIIIILTEIKYERKIVFPL